LGQLIVIVAMFALLWLFLIAPQRRRAQAQKQLLASVQVGDEILTVGGLYGHVVAIDEDDDLEVEIADGLQVRMARRAVAAVIPPDWEDEGEEVEEEEEEDDEAAAEGDETVLDEEAKKELREGEFEPTDEVRS
jgi:preprotein translocase subunit YajC